MSEENPKKPGEDLCRLYEFCRPIFEMTAQLDLTESSEEQVDHIPMKLFEPKGDLPPFQKKLSTRSKTCLARFFGEDIFDDPKKIVDFGVLKLTKIKNLGKKSLIEISEALHSLGYTPVDEAKIWLTDWRKERPPVKAKKQFKINNIPINRTNRKPHLGAMIIDRYADKIQSGLEDLERFDLVDQLKKPVLNFIFQGNKRMILELHAFLEKFSYSFIILTKLGNDIWKLPEKGTRNAHVYISCFPNLIDFIKDNEKNISSDLWGLLFGYPLDEIFDFVYCRENC